MGDRQSDMECIIVKRELTFNLLRMKCCSVIENCMDDMDVSKSVLWSTIALQCRTFKGFAFKSQNENANEPERARNKERKRKSKIF